MHSQHSIILDSFAWCWNYSCLFLPQSCTGPWHLRLFMLLVLVWAAPSHPDVIISKSPGYTEPTLLSPASMDGLGAIPKHCVPSSLMCPLTFCYSSSTLIGLWCLWESVCCGKHPHKHTTILFLFSEPKGTQLPIPSPWLLLFPLLFFDLLFTHCYTLPFFMMPNLSCSHKSSPSSLALLKA